MLTQEYLKSVLHYSPETGVFTNLTNRGSRAKAGHIASRHNRGSCGYARICIDRKDYVAHRLVWLYLYGYFPLEIDHINGDRTDNRLINLRECTRKQNSRNMGKYSNNTSGYKGVSFHKKKNRFRAFIMVDGKSIFLGEYVSDKAAGLAYITASKRLFGEFHCTRVELSSASTIHYP